MFFSFTYMLWIGLAFLGLILALYFFKRRHRERKVSALFLWVSPAQLSGGGRRISWMEKNLLLLLELLAAALLICATAGPSCSAYLEANRIIVVLDASASMDREEIKVKIKDDVAAFLKKESPFNASFITTGRNPKVIMTDVTRVQELEDVFGKWTPDQDSHDFGRSFSLASQLCPPKGQIVFYSDHMPESAEDGSYLKPVNIDWRAFGKTETNYAILGASRKRNYSALKEEFLVTVANFSAEPAAMELSLYKYPDSAENTLVMQQKFRVNANETVNIAFELPRITGDPYRIVLTPSGALKNDDAVVLLSDARPPLRIALDLRSDSEFRPLLEKTLKALEPEAAQSSADKAHLIFSDNLLSEPNLTAWKLLFLGGSPEHAKFFYGPYIVQKSSPLLAGVNMYDQRWAVAGDMENAGSSVLPLISCGGIPLLAEAAIPGYAKSFIMNYIPSRSNLHQTVAWPILMRNFMLYRLEFTEGFETRNLRINESAKCYFPQVKFLNIQSADDASADPVKIQLISGKASFSLESPGVYSITDDAGESKGMLSVLRFAADESDLSKNSAGKAEAVRETTADIIRAQIWRDDSWIFLLSALLVLFLRAGYIKYREDKNNAV